MVFLLFFFHTRLVNNGNTTPLINCTTKSCFRENDIFRKKITW
ncbi:hypothetical protein GLYMA_14G152533v4 [Glycine max]|nr:hypothetical protein GLYMA_14G152533v4 [Glycine max]KAH1094606.1 hypothetical protein GYH30_040060 [Glycine max]